MDNRKSELLLFADGKKKEQKNTSTNPSHMGYTISHHMKSLNSPLTFVSSFQHLFLIWHKNTVIEFLHYFFVIFVDSFMYECKRVTNSLKVLPSIAMFFQLSYVEARVNIHVLKSMKSK